MQRAATGNAAGETRGALEHRPPDDWYPTKAELRRQELEREFPDWQIWTVSRYIGGILWCAKPEDCGDHARNIHAESADELARKIRDAQAGGTHDRLPVGRGPLVRSHTDA